jgi:hypothetical protein
LGISAGALFLILLLLGPGRPPLQSARWAVGRAAGWVSDGVHQLPLLGFLQRPPCRLGGRFLGFESSEAGLVGECLTGVQNPGRSRNEYQVTTTGSLLWIEATDRVFFLREEGIYVLINGRFRPVSESG